MIIIEKWNDSIRPPRPTELRAVSENNNSKSPTQE